MCLGSVPCLLPVSLASADKSCRSDVSKLPDTKNKTPKAKNCARDAEGRLRCESMQRLDDIYMYIYYITYIYRYLWWNRQQVRVLRAMYVVRSSCGMCELMQSCINTHTCTAVNVSLCVGESVYVLPVHWRVCLLEFQRCAMSIICQSKSKH